nr:MAG TPA: Putative head tail adaptor [Caudoviricetes sp.]
MIAGRMKYRLTLLEPKTATNDFGEEATTYTKTRTVHAERVKLSGSRSEEVGEHFPDYRTEFNVRDVHPVAENWRVQQLGGYLYTVTNIVPNLDKGYKTLICVRVNE